MVAKISQVVTRDLGLVPYRDAWRIQEETHAGVASGEMAPTILFVEHPPVITFGRRAELSAQHLVASAPLLAERGVEVVESDRGGDITFHGPGQLVAYPVLRLLDFHLSVGAYVRRLQEAIIAVANSYNIPAGIDTSAIGVWTPRRDDPTPHKLAAIGVRVKQGTTLHGLALNVTTDLSFFDLIVPCGLANRPVTSLRQLLGAECPPMNQLKARLTMELEAALQRKEPRADLVTYGVPNETNSQ